MSWRNWFSASAVIFVFVQLCPADDTYLLRYQFRANEQLRYRNLHSVTQTAASAAGQKVDASKVEQTRVFTIRKINEQGDAEVSMQFAKVKMQIQSDSNPPEVFDSSMPDAEVPQKFRATAQKLKGAAASYSLSPAGTPVSEDGIEQIPEGGQASFMMPLPQDEVAVGARWKVNIKVNVRIAESVKRDILLLRTFQLKSVAENVATITFSTSVASPVKSPSVKAQLLQATPRGTVTFDLARGIVTKRVLTFDRSVLGALGPNTMLSAVGRIEETLLDDDESTVTAR